MGQKGRSDSGNSVAHNALSKAEETAVTGHHVSELRFQMLTVKGPAFYGQEGQREKFPPSAEATEAKSRVSNT